MDMQAAKELVGTFNNGIYAEKGNRWFKVYATEPDGSAFTLEAGYEMNPADYREVHHDIDAALASLAEAVAPELWTEAEF